MKKENVKISLSEIEIYPIKPRNGLIGFTSFVIDKKYFVGDVGIHVRPSGDIRLVYPLKKLPHGKIISCFHPINSHVGSAILEQISAQYYELLQKISIKDVKGEEYDK